MNTKKKFQHIKKQITGLKYINSVLREALWYQEETGEKALQYIYMNQIMEQKFDKILKILTN